MKIKAHDVPSSDKPRILCATDLSERSEHAVQRALLLGRQLNAELLLLHVVDERQLMQVIGLQADRARSVLKWQATQFAFMNDVEVSVRVGKPHRVIADVAKEWRADLVILGAYRKRTGDQFLGTTAERVVRAANRPVLIVNGEATTPYQSVLLASDLSNEFARVAHLTQQLGFLENARVSLVHALEPASREMLYIAGVAEPNIMEYMRSLKQSSRDTLRTQLQTAGLDASHVCVVQEEHARPFRAIERAVDGIRPELLVMGMSRYAALKRLLSSSVANEVLRKIECDVLIVSPAAVERVAKDGTMQRIAQRLFNQPEARA